MSTAELPVGGCVTSGSDTFRVTSTRHLLQALAVSKARLTGRKRVGRATKRIDRAFDRLNPIRARFGAMQNRSRHTTADLASRFEGAAAAETRIRYTGLAAGPTA